ncbi:MAG: DUF2059 domain-containing protein [Limnobacter sp.]|nr:DUF2059 domain-containing protein [Limnobacter sp.]
MTDQSKPAIQSIIEESAVELVNSLSFSLGFEGFNIEDQDMEVIDEQTIAFYSNLLSDPAVVEAQTRLYESTFSAEELKAIANFYSTEPGQKLLKESSRLNRSVRSAVQSRMYEQMPQYMSALKVHLKAPHGVSRGVTLSNPLAMPVGMPMDIPMDMHIGPPLEMPQAVQATSSNAASVSSFK